MALTKDDKQWIVDTVVSAVRDVEYNLMQEIKALRRELDELREEVRALDNRTFEDAEATLEIIIDMKDQLKAFDKRIKKLESQTA